MKLEKIHTGWYRVIVDGMEIGQVNNFKGFWTGEVKGVKFSGIAKNTRREAVDEVVEKFNNR